MSERRLPDTISFTYNSFQKILQGIVNNFGSAGESIIFQMGKEYGIDFCQNVLSHREKNELELKELFTYVISEGSKDGWANMEIHEFNPQNGLIEVLFKQNVFQPLCLNLHQPQCFFLRGYISGVIKELTNMDYMFFSSQCYSNGDEHCSVRLIAESS